MANILIIYATRQGQTRKIAERIAQRLRSDGHSVELGDTDDHAPTRELREFDAVFVGAPIHGGGYPRSLVRFVRAHEAELEALPSAFFSVGLAVASRTTDGRAETLPLVERFVRQTGWQPARVELIAGALTYSKYNFVIRYVMRHIAKQAGGDTDTTKDYEYTDWAAVERFATEFISSALGRAESESGAGRTSQAVELDARAG